MLNSNVKQSLVAGGIAFALCLVSMLAGGLTWLTGAAGWLIFLSLVFSAGVGLIAWRLINAAAAQRWQNERHDTIDRLNDAQRCIKAEEQAHGRTRQELISVRQQLTTAEFDATTAKTEYGNMRDRAAERGRTIKALEDRIASDNNTWRKQVSNMRSAAMDLYKALDDMKFSNDDLDAVQNLMDGLLALAEAGGVPEVDARQVTIDEAPAAFEAAPLPETPLHIAHQLMAKVRANQAVRRDNLDRLCKAIEDGYELGEAITSTYHRGALCVTDDMIANEIAAVKAWEVGQRHADKGWHK